MRDINKLFDHITLLESRGAVYPCCNCLLIDDGVKCLIDSASPELMGYVKETNRKIDVILTSHGHVDHFLKNHEFPSTPMLLHKADHDMATSGEVYHRSFHFDEFGDIPLEPLLQALQYNPCVVSGTLHDGQKIEVGSTEIEVLHLPGHTLGHCGFLFQKEGFVFLADITLDPVGPAYLNTNSDIDDFIASINRVIELKPDMVITGHRTRPFIKHIDRHLTIYRDKIFEREERVIGVLQAGKHTLQEIAAEMPVYKKLQEPGIIWHAYELSSCRHHLNRLIKMGKVELRDNRYFLVDGIRTSNLNLG